MPAEFSFRKERKSEILFSYKKRGWHHRAAQLCRDFSNKDDASDDASNVPGIIAGIIIAGIIGGGLVIRIEHAFSNISKEHAFCNIAKVPPPFQT